MEEKATETVETKVEEKGTKDANEESIPVVKTGASAWRLIKDAGDLWRFTTGYTPSKECVPGDECVVIRSDHGYYCDYYPKNKWLRNFWHETGNLQKFKIKYLGDGQITLESYDGYWIEADPAGHYIYCGRTSATQTPQAKHKFYVYISDGDTEYTKDWCICVKSVVTGQYWSARKAWDSWFIGQKDEIGSWEIFWGYKNGKKEDWEQRDEWQWITELTNNTSDTDTLKFKQKVGSSKTESSTVTWEGGANITLGDTFGEAFKAGIQTSVNYSWSQTSAETWYEEKEYEVDLPVGPGKTVALYQIVGLWGNVVSKTPKYKSEEKEDASL